MRCRWPIPEAAALLCKFPAILRRRPEPLRIKGDESHAPRYDLTIDDQKVGTWTREQLANGINLSQQAGPITAQAQQVFQKVIQKNNLYFTRWRQVQIYQAPAWLQTVEIETARNVELARLDAQIAALENEINALRKPLPRVWQLSPAASLIPMKCKCKAMRTVHVYRGATLPMTSRVSSLSARSMVCNLKR
jgi:hypothetical protein